MTGQPTILKAPTPGTGLVLTIDATVQYLAERELDAAWRATGAKGGMVLAMDPRTGEILAMAMRPTFNPNTYQVATAEQWRNRAVTDPSSPGSTFKAILAAAALEDGVVSPGDRFYGEQGVITIANRTIHDWKKYGWLTFQQVLQHSSNVGAIKVGLQLGRERYYRHITGFGFGSLTGVGLPGESRGQLRPPDRWSGLSLASISIGQEVSVTGVQMLAAFGAIANGGRLMRPHVVRAAARSERPGGPADGAPGRAPGRSRPRTAATLTDILTSVVAEGTGHKAVVQGYAVAGKTGTAQKPDPVTHIYSRKPGVLSFIGFVPSSAPRLVILALLDEPKTVVWGSEAAAPIFAAVAAPILRHLDVPPTEAMPAIQIVRGAAGRRPGASGGAGRGGCRRTGKRRCRISPGRVCARRWPCWGRSTSTWRWRDGASSCGRRRPRDAARLPAPPAGWSWRPRALSGWARDGADRRGTREKLPRVLRRCSRRCRSGRSGFPAQHRPRPDGRLAPGHAPGSCFVAVRGLRADGHRFIPQAVEQGAGTVVAEPPDPLPGEAVGRILVPDTRRALPRLADAYFGHPSRALTVVGITGTNGKTTTSYLCEALLRARGLETGVIGTIQYVVRGQARDAGQTTPEAIELQGLLAEMVAAGVGGRGHGGVLARPRAPPRGRRRVRRGRVHESDPGPSRLPRDDARRTRAPRRACSSSSCAEGRKPGATAVLNADDPVGAEWAAALPGRALTFGLRPGHAIRPLQHESGLEGIRLLATSPAGPVRIVSPLIGEHNVMNLLGAMGVGRRPRPRRPAIAVGARLRDPRAGPVRAGGGRSGLPGGGRLRPHARRAPAGSGHGAAPHAGGGSGSSSGRAAIGTAASVR